MPLPPTSLPRAPAHRAAPAPPQAMRTSTAPGVQAVALPFPEGRGARQAAATHSEPRIFARLAAAVEMDVRFCFV